MLTPAMEDYLKAIYKLQRTAERVTTSAVAAQLEVTAASATNMVKRLAALRLVEHEPYRGVTLTLDGQRAALELLRHHRLIELFLQHALGYSLHEVDAEAERLEHAVTHEFAARIETALGMPTHDPHGHPIPNRDLEFPAAIDSLHLADVTGPGVFVVQTLDDADAERLRYLAGLGLAPGSRVEVLEVGPFEGPLTLAVDGAQVVIGRELARHVTIDAP